MGLNFRTYHYAVERARAGESLYDVPPPDTYEWAVYLYPPGTLPSFYPFSLVSWQTGYAIMTVLSVLAAAGATVLVVRYVESLGPELGWLDVGLIFSAFTLSTHAYGTIFFGNINIILAFIIVGGFWALQRNRGKLAGGAFAIAALYKLFPALIGLWLVRVRRWHAVTAAVVTGVSGILLGVLLYGLAPTQYYFTDVIAGRTEAEQFSGGYPVDGIFYVTIQQPISRLVSTIWPSAPYLAILGISVLVCMGILAYFYRDLGTALDRQMAIFATLAVMVIIVPSLHWYLIFLFLPMAVILYLWQAGPGRYLFIAGGVLFSLSGSTGKVVAIVEQAPGPIATIGLPIASAATPPLYGILVMIGACAWHKYRRDEQEPRTAASGAEN